MSRCSDRRRARPAHRRLPGTPPKPRRSDGVAWPSPPWSGSTGPGDCRPMTCSAGSALSWATGRPGRRRQRWVWSAGPGRGSADRGATGGHRGRGGARASVRRRATGVDRPDRAPGGWTGRRCRTCGRRPCARGRCIAALGRRRLGGAPGAAATLAGHPGAAVVVDPAAAGGDAHVASRSCPGDRATDVARGARRRRRLRHRIGRTGRRRRACRWMRSAGSAPTGRSGSPIDGAADEARPDDPRPPRQPPLQRLRPEV